MFRTTRFYSPEPAAAVADPPPAAAPAPAASAAVDPPPAPPAAPAPSASAAPAATPPAEPAPPPGAPEKYALVLPDGGPFTAAMLPAIEREARALNLTQEAAQGLLIARIESAKALGTQYLAETKADPEIGGAKFDETVKFAQAGRDWLFPKDSKGAALVVQFFEATGLGNHPEFLRAFARIGRATQEDHPTVSGAAGASRPVELKDLMYPTTRRPAA